MISLENYSEKTKGIDFSKQTEAIQKGHKFFLEYSDLYNDDDDIKKAIDNHLQRLNDADFLKQHLIVAKVAKPEEKKVDAFFRENGQTGIPKFKTGQTVYVKATGEELMVERISKKGLVIPGQPSEGRYHYSTNNDSYYEEELTDVKPVKKTEKVEKMKVGDKVLRIGKNKTGKVVRVYKPKKGSALESEPYLIDVKYDNNTKAINMQPSGFEVYEKASEVVKVKPAKTPKTERNKKKVEEKKKKRETPKEKETRIVNAEQFIKDVENNADLRNLTESQIIGIGLQFESNYRTGTAQKRDESHDGKKRLSPTPENLLRWMKHPGKFDLIGVDTFTRTDATSDYKREISKQKFWNNIFKIKIKA